ncbi:hypothetical protein Malapachy_1053 [Malassezia pachydermatis]|uniref:S-adenosylmethionine-dependent methyltransferase n=1 Tax=Malassezia pachydermatis TaxID=77020 RepID=A0A0M8MQN0_9BASI|nr:hypothetical protein Malapachy_1053 [Malassezia pachydermatis]KOS14887.1 hypothetical protein Malapachy_1053 [Malassezia pachydermatis]
MSFAFGFSVDDGGEEALDSLSMPTTTDVKEHVYSEKTRQLSKEELYAQLPDKLSYSPLHISHGPQPMDLARRDLFDVRFQILNEEGKFADADSDLIPGVYEGGLKTWECALDLVAELQKQELDTSKNVSWYAGKHIAELGCGTAIPTCYLLQSLLGTVPPATSSIQRTTLSLCDYNEQVLSLVR